MTEDAPPTSSGEPKKTPDDPAPNDAALNDPPPDDAAPNDPPPVLAPADAVGGRPTLDGPAPAPPPPVETAVVGAPPPPGGTTTAVMDPPPPPLPAATAPEKPGRPGMGLLPIAIGVGLLAAAVVLSSFRSRSDGDLDWSNYGVGLGATAVLLLVALAAVALGSGRGREELVTWPGSIGVLAAGVMIGIGLDDVDNSEDWLPYLVGGVIVLLSVLGYVAVRRGAFVVTGILGLGLAYVQLADDVLVDIGDKDDQAIIVAVTITVFVLAVTAVGWLLRTRAISGIVAGVIGVIGLNAVLLMLVVAQLFASMFDGPDITTMSGQTEDGAFFLVSTDNGPDYDNDVYVVLALAALLTLLWALAASLNGNPGFTVLAIAMPASVVPDATFVLAVEHPTWWGVGFAAAGAILLGLVGLKQLTGRNKTT